jgi:hypothetical protein
MAPQGKVSAEVQQAVSGMQAAAVELGVLAQTVVVEAELSAGRDCLALF